MKIVVKKNNNPLYVYHHPRDVSYDPESLYIRVGSTEPVEFHLKDKPELEWIKCPNSRFSELCLTFEIIEADKGCEV